MLNKNFKTIHNKYLKFFTFIFFLRYLLAIFLISMALFLIIPNFFTYEKERADVLKGYLLKNYNLEINSYEKIKFKSLPYPRLEFENLIIELADLPIELKVDKLKIYPKIFSIYNYDNFQTKKIALKNNNVDLELSNFKYFINKIFTQKNKIHFDNLNLNIFDQKKTIIKIKNINYSNFGYNQNLITGKIFEKDFEIKLNKDFRSLNFLLLNSGIEAEVKFHDISNKHISGNLKTKILNTNLKFNFHYNFKVLKIYDSYFRSKNITFKNESSITFKPFLDIKSKFDLDEFNTKILKRIDFDKLINSKKILKKINGTQEINFKSKKFSNYLINKLYLKINLSHGRLNYLKKLSISENISQCEGYINFLEEFPILSFNCFLVLNNKKKLFKKLSIKQKGKQKITNLKVVGNLNIKNKKIKFENILINESQKTSKVDIQYFKNIFEDIFLERNLIDLLNTKKIKEFILEIS